MKELAEKCGVFGVYAPGMDVSRMTLHGLQLLQHRGQESSGIAVCDGNEIDCHTGEGLVTKVYNERIIKSLRGHAAIGHNRYSTSGGTGAHHAQPVVIDSTLALAHNGNLPSVTALQKFATEHSIETFGLTDSELMTQALAYHFKKDKPIKAAVKECYPLFTGAFSVVALTQDCLFAFRDQCGIRPLSIGRINGGYVISSETCALNIVGAEYIRDVNPGELVVINQYGLHSWQIVPANPKLDIFEYVYFARPDSIINGKLVEDVRHNCGLQLAEEYPLDVDIVVPVPDTAIPAALAYSWARKIPMRMGLAKNRYIHRTFIQPDSHTRGLGVKMKLFPIPQVLSGKKVALVDDSIVRGTTSKELVNSLHEAGAKEVHLLIHSPPVCFPDFYGIDTPHAENLIAVGRTVEEVRQYIGADSLSYLSLDGLIKAIGLPRDELCLSCFTGEYPIDLHEKDIEVKALSTSVGSK